MTKKGSWVSVPGAWRARALNKRNFSTSYFTSRVVLEYYSSSTRVLAAALLSALLSKTSSLISVANRVETEVGLGKARCQDRVYIVRLLWSIHTTREHGPRPRVRAAKTGAVNRGLFYAKHLLLFCIQAMTVHLLSAIIYVCM